MTFDRSFSGLLATLVLWASSCAATNKEPEPSWQTAEVFAPSDTVLWKLSLQSLQRMGFPLGAGLDRGAMTAETGWKMDLHPFSRKGQRTRAVLKMRPKERGVWMVQARVKLQVNKELGRPLDPRYADWEWKSDDVDAARILLQHVRSALGPRLAPYGSGKDSAGSGPRGDTRGHREP